jgi:hypothetical protein
MTRPDRVNRRGRVINQNQKNGGNVTRPRAADDFPSIRARMVELGREHARPRAADDFAMIRARMEALRRERAAQVLAEARGGSVINPRPFHRTEGPTRQPRDTQGKTGEGEKAASG